jgi:hypothetical protein
MAAFDITIQPRSLTIKPGSSGSIMVVVSNRLGRPVMGLVEGSLTPASASKWLVPPPELQRRYEPDPAATVNYEFKIAVPADAPTQSAQFKASVRDVLSPDDTRVEGQTVAINVTPNPVVAPSPGRKMPWWVWLVAAVLVLGVGLGIYLALRPKGVPSVIGMTREKATARLESAGFVVAVKDTTNEEDEDIDIVVRQEPEAKSKLPTGNKKGNTPATIVVNRQKAVETGGRALEHINQAILVLDNPSQAWQGTMTQLEQQLRQDTEPNLANEVAQVGAKGTPTAGTEIRCTPDFIRQRMRLDLQRIAARLKNEPIPQIEPVYCDVVPKAFAMGQPPDQVQYYGYDLNAPGADVVLRYTGGEEQLSVSHPAHYLITFNPRAAGLCNKENRQIVLKLKGGDRGAVSVAKFQCPTSPPPPAPAARQLLTSQIQEIGTGLGGTGPGGYSNDHEYGTRCTPGYVRQQCRVVRELGGGSCSAEGVNPRKPEVRLGWVDDDPTNGVCRVHYGIGPFDGVKCRIEIFEVGEQQPRQPDPPCPCW